MTDETYRSNNQPHLGRHTKIVLNKVFCALLIGLHYITLTQNAFAAKSSGDVGMPQLDTSSYASQIFWLVVCFFSLYILMARVALPYIEKIIEMRNKIVQGNLEEATALKSQAEDIKIAYDQALMNADRNAHDYLNNAIATTQHDLAERYNQASDKFQQRIADMEQKLLKDKEKLISQADNTAESIARDIYKQLLGSVKG